MLKTNFYSHVICLDLLKQGFMPKSEAPMGASFFTYGGKYGIQGGID